MPERGNFRAGTCQDFLNFADFGVSSFFLRFLCLACPYSARGAIIGEGKDPFGWWWLMVRPKCPAGTGPKEVEF